VMVRVSWPAIIFPPLIKNGGERGIRTPGTAFDRTTV
jgi:hypothetical protein